MTILGKLLGMKQVKPKQLPAHVARIKKSMRDQRAAVLSYREAPTPETAEQIIKGQEKLLILLAGCPPEDTKLADINFPQD
jgi:hypothetical protein